ncbi:MAG: response regulator [Candidatus Pacebacteria bacterium]|nr:response regulator [Candidatus Paceibacterota bacterium]
MKTVLLVEDDPFLVEIYNTKLKEAGFSVEIATDGEEALKKLNDAIFDLVLLDIVLPVIDGWEFIQKIKTDDRFKSLKIVVLSNLGRKEEIERGVKLGVAKYLVKAHHTPSEVINEVRELLE